MSEDTGNISIKAAATVAVHKIKDLNKVITGIYSFDHIVFNYHLTCLSTPLLIYALVLALTHLFAYLYQITHSRESDQVLQHHANLLKTSE